tara:strand:- start:252 stop:578 length:327 start_codon:yes stop_codon:yes gene_type:complete
MRCFALDKKELIMNTSRTDYLTAHCQRNGWDLITYTDTHVVFMRSFAPCGDGLYYGTIEYHREWSGFCHGHYDMTLDQALESAMNRTVKKLGHTDVLQLIRNTQKSAA